VVHSRGDRDARRHLVVQQPANLWGAWSLRRRSPGRDRHFPRKLPNNGAHVSTRIVRANLGAKLRREEVVECVVAAASV
jgi:hypothetical protein